MDKGRLEYAEEEQGDTRVRPEEEEGTSRPGSTETIAQRPFEGRMGHEKREGMEEAHEELVIESVQTEDLNLQIGL